MVATLAALGAAVVLALAYVLLTERMDEASFARRRLDAWVFLAGVACLVTMLYGGANVARSRGLSAYPTAQVELGPETVARLHPISLSRVMDASGMRAEPAPGAPVDPAMEADARAPDAEVEAGGAPEPVPYVALRGERPRPTVSDSSWLPPLADVVDAQVNSGVYTPSLAILPPGVVAPVEPVVVVPPTAPLPPPPTSTPPAAAPPAPEPSPWPSPTPFCGDPRQIVIDLDVLDATIERGDEMPTVRYRAQVHNRSTFPVTLVDVLVTLEGRDSGSERFGHVRLPEVRVEPSVVHALEGTMTLSKSPSPFGNTQFCVSLIPETCGQAVPYHLTKRCVGTRGF